jgi:hypothetical protein
MRLVRSCKKLLLLLPKQSAFHHCENYRYRFPKQPGVSRLRLPVGARVASFRRGAVFSAHEFSDGRHRFNVIAEYLEDRQDRNCKDHPGNAPHPTPKGQGDQDHHRIEGERAA